MSGWERRCSWKQQPPVSGLNTHVGFLLPLRPAAGVLGAQVSTGGGSQSPRALGGALEGREPGRQVTHACHLPGEGEYWKRRGRQCCLLHSPTDSCPFVGWAHLPGSTRASFASQRTSLAPAGARPGARALPLEPGLSRCVCFSRLLLSLFLELLLLTSPPLNLYPRISSFPL